MKTRTVRWLVALVVLVSLSVFGYHAAQRMSDREKVVKMTSKMKTVCVGRFLIDLPVDAEVDLNGAFVGGFDVRGIEESRENFDARLSAREAQIAAEPNELGRKNLESVKSVELNGFSGRIFTFGRSSSYTFDRDVRQDWVAVKLEGYVNANGKTFSFITDAYDPARTSKLDKWIDQLRALPSGSIPTAPGLCFGAGMLLNPIGADQAEKVVLFAGLPGHPDVRIAFNTMAGLQRTWPNLLERRAQAASRQPLWMRALFSTLRSGPRSINGLAGEEAVTKVTERNFSVVYGLDWEVPGTENNVLEPAIHLEMSTGNNPEAGGPPIQSSLGQQALLDVWDKIVSSIRLRPTNVEVAIPPPPTGFKLGALATAGESCPENGWWTCADGVDGVTVLGGSRQYVRKGQRMPQALLLPPQTLWEKVRGMQPSYESTSPTAWTLVDKRTRLRGAPPVALDQAKGITRTAAAAADTDGVVPPPPIGMNAATGAPCPASGWWHCEEINALDGTRWFAQGSLFPAATLVIPCDSGKVASATKTIHRRGAWRLVRLAPAPDPEIGNGSSDDTES